MRPCKVCMSPNRELLERRRGEGLSYKELEKLAATLGEEISFMSFFRHFCSKHTPMEHRKPTPKRWTWPRMIVVEEDIT